MMTKRIDRIEVNHRHVADMVSVSTPDDGMTAHLHISQPMSTVPLMFMQGATLVLSRTQWRRLRAAVDKALQLEKEPLEGALRGWAVLQLVGKQDGSAWNAYVEEAAGDGRYAAGTGPTIDAAIRAAIANAKEHG